jgi:transglutaminase-like putative cysteine protease
MPPNDQTKWAFLSAVPAHDTQNPDLRSLAAGLGAIAALTPDPDWCYANLALALVRDCIAYQLDNERVGREQIDGYTDPYQDPLLALRRGVDDCDAKARLFVALCLARGLSAEMVPRWKGNHLSHVYARVQVRGPGNPLPRWWTAETILRRARLGDVAENVPKELETGKWSF